MGFNQSLLWRHIMKFLTRHQNVKSKNKIFCEKKFQFDAILREKIGKKTSCLLMHDIIGFNFIYIDSIEKIGENRIFSPVSFNSYHDVTL